MGLWKWRNNAILDDTPWTIGCLVLDEQCCWIFALPGHERGGNPVFVEAMALKLGLSKVWDRGHRSVVYKTDCVELVSILEESNP